MTKKLPPESRDDLPRVSVTLTDETCWITRYDAGGKAGATYPALVDDVANAFRGHGGLTTGLLPTGLLFLTEARGRQRLGYWVEPARRTLKIAARRGRSVRVRAWLPGLLLVGQGREYWVYAAAARPEGERDLLYHAPLPNVHGTGLICQGSVAFPKATAAAMPSAAAAFLESEFNSDLAEGKVRNHRGTLLAFLRSLRGRFPAGRLVPAGVTVGDVMTGRRGARLDYDDAD